jgi:hypothetical protein
MVVELPLLSRACVEKKQRLVGLTVCASLLGIITSYGERGYGAVKDARSGYIRAFGVAVLQHGVTQAEVQGMHFFCFVA